MNLPVYHILLIDDDEDDFILTRQMFLLARRGNYTLDWACSCPQGLELARTRPYDAILIDYDLGSCTGAEMIHALSAAGVSAPLVLYSGSQWEDLHAILQDRVMIGYLPKNQVNAAFLEEAILHAIQLKSMDELLGAYRTLIQNEHVQVRPSLNTIPNKFSSIFHSPVPLAGLSR